MWYLSGMNVKQRLLPLHNTNISFITFRKLRGINKSLCEFTWNGVAKNSARYKV